MQATDGKRQLCFLDRDQHRPPAVPVSTSIAAAEAIADQAPTLRGKVFQFVGRSQGATRQEIADGLHMKLQTVCARIGELKELHLVWEGDEKRDGRRVVRVRNHG
jgi:hypothetical protein